MQTSEALLYLEVLLERNLAVKGVFDCALVLKRGLLLFEDLYLSLDSGLFLAGLVPFLHDLVVFLRHLVIVVGAALGVGLGLEKLLVRLRSFVKLINLLLQGRVQRLKHHEL